MCRLIQFLALLLCLLCLASGQLEDCGQEPPTLLCRGERAIRNVIRNLGKSDKPLVIMRGLEIVPLRNDSAAQEWRSQRKMAFEEDESLLDSLAFYLRTHEVNLKLADLLNESRENQVSEARKKDKGQGLLLAMALMFGKMMAVLGLSAIGALAMKALGVSLVALTLAGLLGLKSAAQQGHESSHSISYVTGEGHHHKRRRRAAAMLQVVTEQPPNQQQQRQPLRQPLAYRGWQR